MTKRILITGKNSYVGNQLAEWLSQEPEQYKVTKKSVRNDKWKKIDFSVFDVVVHVAGIAHQDTKTDQKELYYKVNTELTIKIAQKAKEQGVKQFIFLSSIIVYGASSKVGDKKVITLVTEPKPINFYGNSKLLAEKGIKSLQSKSFDVVIIRPPMIYGKESKGNYPLLAQLAKKTPIFPDIINERSMLHIDNLCEFIKAMIDQNEKGLFFPQNKEYVQTSNLVKIISEYHGKKIWLTKIFNPILMLFCNFNLLNKVFGNMVYDKEMSNYEKVDYQIWSLEETVELTEK